MEILYRQATTGDFPLINGSDPLGLERFYIKRLYYKSDRAIMTRKGHHHTGFEIHIIEHGYQTYEIDGKDVTVNAGELLIVYPLISHIAKSEDLQTKKFAITFSTASDSALLRTKEHIGNYFISAIPSDLYSNLCYIKKEHDSNKPYSHAIIASRAHECALMIFRLLGVSDCIHEPHIDGDERLLLAKQYIRDNVLRPITLPEVASYCCISTKQLTRIFSHWEGITLTEYVRKQRCLYIEKLLCDRNLSLREISEMMNFSSEYYFNALFKRHSGMSPGAYRKTLWETPDK